MAGVTIEGLTKYYGDVMAVRDLDLEVRDGELLVVVGPSGCGKSTVLRTIAGLETPTSGRIRVGERDVTDLAPADRDLAMVFQNYALYPHLTVRDNLGFGLRMRGTPKAEMRRRVEEAAASLGLDRLLKRKPAALSGGERQRVALGRAIVREPAVFLFDEPLSNLDARLRLQTRAELVRLHRELGTTMIYVTHDQTEAMTMGQRIAILNLGELQQLASPLEVYDRPANLFVAGFIGSPSMNLIPGRLTRDEGTLFFEGEGIRAPLPPGLEPSEARVEKVVLGVRPEHVRIGPPPTIPPPDQAPPTNGAPDTRARVLVVETLGSETLLYCATEAGGQLVARTAARPGVAMEDRVSLHLDRGHLLLFDGAGGDRIETGDG